MAKLTLSFARSFHFYTEGVHVIKHKFHKPTMDKVDDKPSPQPSEKKSPNFFRTAWPDCKIYIVGILISSPTTWLKLFVFFRFYFDLTCIQDPCGMANKKCLGAQPSLLIIVFRKFTLRVSSRSDVRPFPLDCLRAPPILLPVFQPHNHVV